MLYHITTRSRWKQAKRGGQIPIPNPDEAFIHCSWRRQILQVAERLYQGRADLMLIRVDPHRVRAPIVEEDLYQAGETFPHVYGPIPLEAVVSADPFTSDERGRYTFPHDD